MCGDQVTITCHVEPKSTAALTTQGSTKVWLLDLAAVCLDGSDPCPGLLGKTNARFVERVRGSKHCCGLAHTMQPSKHPACICPRCEARGACARGS